MRTVVLVSIFVIALAACSGSRNDTEVNAGPAAGSADIPREQPGLHNVLRFDEGVISGSVPHGEAGFDSLKQMGVRTVISVDGAKPDLEAAEARGMRYVHVPIQYSGIDEEDRLTLARAMREVEGPVYVHCHHGRHRGPAAAAFALAACARIAPDTGVALLREAGTSGKYPGLYAAVGEAEPIDDAIIRYAMSRGEAELVSEAKVESFVAAMAGISEAYEHIESMEKAGWRTPPDHPDLVPAAEASRLSDLFRDIMDSDHMADKQPDYRDWMRDARDASAELEEAITNNKPDAASRARERLDTSCNNCHATYRNE